jgi:hypothetical protein
MNSQWMKGNPQDTEAESQPPGQGGMLLKRRHKGRLGRFALAVAALLSVAGVCATDAQAQPSAAQTVQQNKHYQDGYDQLETYLRANVQNARLALYRTYLPKNGRRAVPLPTIQRVTSDGTEAPLPECALTSRIDNGSVDFSSLLQMLTDGTGDEIDFIVGLARALRIDPTPENFPSCAWWGFVDERFFDWIFPDATATYWFQPFLAPPQDQEYPQWLIRGQFVQERYKSYALYDAHFNPFEWLTNDSSGDSLIFDSTVTDYQMKPSDGENPFITPNLPVDQYGFFKVLMKNQPAYSDSQLSDTNVIPMQSNTQAGQGQYTREGAKIPLPVPCGRSDSPSACPLEGIFQIPSKRLEQGVVSNVNNAYVVTVTDQLTPRATEPLQQGPFALVIRGRMPRTTGSANPPSAIQCRKTARQSFDVCYCQRNPDACEPVPWTGKGNPYDPAQQVYSGPLDPNQRDSLDMRYWSICTAVYARPYPTIGNILPRERFRENTGCVPDSDIIQTDADGTPDPHGGWFTVVITTEENKPDIFKDQNGGVRNATVGANWIQGVAGVKMLVNLRNMFANDNFKFAATRAEADSAWQSTYNTMQEYYPVISATCSVQLINTQGWGACVAPALTADTCGALSTCQRTDARSPIGVPGAVSATQ